VQQFRKRGLRDCFRLMDLEPTWGYGYATAAIILHPIGKRFATVELTFRVEERCEDGAKAARSLRVLFPKGESS